MSDHAISNARGWAETILAAMNAFQALNNVEAASVEFKGETFDDPDALLQRIEEMPLSVLVRGGWYTPGGEVPEPEDFEILLSTNGPALRIFGAIGGVATLQWKDSGTPWVDYLDTTDDQDEAIAAFVGMFWFGE